MSIFMRIIARVGPLAGTGAIILGLLNWFFHISFIEVHMILGLIVTIALLITGLVAMFTQSLRILGVISTVFALIVPVFGLNQMLILVGNFHWLIQVVHLLVGVAAVVLTEKIGERYLQIKQKPVASEEAVQVS